MYPFTDTYIAMAKACAEIEARSPSLNDLKMGQAAGNAFLTENGVFIVGSNTKFEDIPHILLSWLPRLDQILGMLGAPEAFFDAIDYGPELSHYFSASRNDWNELALAVVMRQKFGKRWDGKEWVLA